MRNILFRGKRIDNGKWVEGYYTKSPITDENSGLPMECGMYFLTGEERHLIIQDGAAFTILPESVGQYTGLTDKNGVKVFEGDIVHCISRFDNANMAIIFEEGEFHMVLCENYKDYIPLAGYHCIRNFIKEVIGNIHDNPNLLGGD